MTLFMILLLFQLWFNAIYLTLAFVAYIWITLAKFLNIIYLSHIIWKLGITLLNWFIGIERKMYVKVTEIYIRQSSEV